MLNRLAAAEEEVASIAGLRAAHPAIAVSFVEAEPDESLPLLPAGEVVLPAAARRPPAVTAMLAALQAASIALAGPRSGISRPRAAS